MMMNSPSAAGVMVSTVLHQGTGAGSTPSAALHPQTQFTPKDIVIKPIPNSITLKSALRSIIYIHILEVLC
jgi:hypothetical protein